MTRDIDALPTLHRDVTYRSRTEARWAVFFDALDLIHYYEAAEIGLSTGESYLPDFFLPELDAYFEVKPSSDAVVTAECRKARILSKDRPGQRVWLAMGAPSSATPNILTLEHWAASDAIELILSTAENRYRFLEDRRDEHVYWLQADYYTGVFRHSFVVGGKGKVTDHDRLPLLHRHVEEAYLAARQMSFSD
jgi:hypothetical protein